MAEYALLKRFAVTVDLKQRCIGRIFEVVEGDTGNVVEVTVLDGGAPVDLTGVSVKAVFSSPAGTAVQEGDSISLGEGVVTIRLYPGSYAAGPVEAELQLYSAGEAAGGEGNDVLVTTARFGFDCRRAILNADSITAMPQFPMLTELANSIGQAEAERVLNENARQSAEFDRAYAEQIRRLNESRRIDAELARAAAEETRAIRETLRASAEEGRVSAELARAAAETARADAEAVRAAAETEREEAFEAMMSHGAGMSVGEGEPTPSMEGSLGGTYLDESTGRAYVCTSVYGAPGSEERIWSRISFVSPWRTVVDTTTETNEAYFDVAGDAYGRRFNYDELRVTIIGCMTGASSANIYVNGDEVRYIRDNSFMNRDGYDPSESITQFTLSAPEFGFIRMHRELGGIVTSGSYSSAKAPQTALLKVNGFAGYTRVKIGCVSASASFLAGTRLIVEGRNIN